jgi:hypothetical protein
MYFSKCLTTATLLSLAATCYAQVPGSSANLPAADLPPNAVSDQGRITPFAQADVDQAPTPRNLQALPQYVGTVQLFTLTPRGEIDGLILTDGMEVKMPPALSTSVSQAIRVGDEVTVRGLKATGIPLLQAASITDSATRRTIVDRSESEGGPPEVLLPRATPPEPGAPQVSLARPDSIAQGPGERPIAPPSIGIKNDRALAADNELRGHVRMRLHGPLGDINGVLLDTGTVLRLPPDSVDRFTGMLKPGQPLVAQGPVVRNSAGVVMDVHRLGSSEGQLIDLRPAPVPSGPRAPTRP